MQLLCRHILAAGRQCAAVALSGKNFCFHHNHLHVERRSSGLRSHIAPPSPTQSYDLGTIPVPEPVSRLPIALEFPEDPASILTNIYRVTSLLLAGHIDRPTANSVTYGMQVCLSALHGKPLIEPASTPQTQSPSDDDSDSTQPAPAPTRTVSRVILTPEGDEIAPPVEILEPNEAEPIHHRLCPCLLCAEKYRNQPPEEHHPDCQCGLCEEQDSELSDQSTELLNRPSPITNDDVILSEATAAGVPADRSSSVGWAGSAVEGPAVPEPATIEGAPSFATRSEERDNADLPASGLAQQGSVEAPVSPETKAGPQDRTSLPQAEAKPAGGATLHPAPYPLRPKRRIARASALLSGSANRDPLNRPWSIAEYTFGDAIRRHEAQYAARAAAALAVGIEPPPYEPYLTGLLRPGTPEYEEDQQMQQHSSQYWATHFRKLIAEQPDIQPFLNHEQQNENTEA